MKLLRVALLALIGVSCTNQKLVPITAGDPPVVDDLLEVDANFCTRPATDVAFPVKLVLVVDASGSMQFTDQPGLRVNAVRELVNTFRSQSNVLISTVGFGSNIYTEPPITGPNDPLFVPAAQWNEPDFLTLKDVTTDYVGALDGIKSILLLDMLKSDPAELARTKYVIVFFSDGAADPRCCSTSEETVGLQPFNDPFNCPNESWETQNPGQRFCEGFEENDICNTSTSLDNFKQNVNAVVGATGQPNFGQGVTQALQNLQPDANYNRAFQIEDLVQDVVDLGDHFGVGSLTFNTALLYDDTLPDAVKQIGRLNKCREASLLQKMADIGHGQFRDFEGSGQIDFLSFNFTSLKQGFTLIDSYAHNLNALPPGGDPAKVDFRPDSDGDGLDDDTEFALGTDPTVRDSDKQVEPTSADIPPIILQDPASWGDGFDDNFENQRQAIGFDPRFQKRPIKVCPATPQFDLVDREDLDGDGLNGCEEQILGTNPKLADSDGDTIPDGIEVRLGMDPTTPEGDKDDDFDGTPNVEEVRKGRDPHVPDSNREQTSVRYELTAQGQTEDGRTCYASKARGVHLATTQPRFVGGRRGFNDILWFIAEAPIDNPTGRIDMRQGCVRVQYIKPSFKDPIQGQVVLNETNDICNDDSGCANSKGHFCVDVNHDRDLDGVTDGNCSDFIDLSDPATIDRLSAGQDLCVGLEVQ